MRIGISFLSFGKDIFAGIENSLYNLALGLAANEASVHVYSGRLSGNEDVIDGITVYRSDLLPSSLPDGDDTVRKSLSEKKSEISRELAEFVYGRDIDFLYVCDPLWGVAQLTEAWNLVKIPMLLSLHVLNTREMLRDSERSPFRIYTAVSDTLRSQVLEYASLRPFFTIPNSVDTHRFRPLGSHSGSRIVFCNARISPEKGIINLVSSFPTVLKALPDAELWLCAGESSFGDQRSHLREVRSVVEGLGIASHVQFLPKLAWDEIPEVTREAGVVVLPSYRETFGLAALEGMACGKAVIASRIGNLPALIQGAGVLVDPGESLQLAEAIISILCDAERQARLGDAGVQRAQLFSNKRVAADLLRLMITC
jgi:glycosyltransferase involved in cell wall biosynthesis